MNFQKAVSPSVTIADQPSEAEIRALKDQGYVGVVNLRNDGEPEQPLDTTAEGDLARSVGLDYLSYGVGGAPLTVEGVTAVGRFLDEHAGGKTLVHCRKGARAAALVLLHRASQEGWTADEAVARGAAEGLGVEGGLKMIVEAYLRDHPPAPG